MKRKDVASKRPPARGKLAAKKAAGAGKGRGRKAPVLSKKKAIHEYGEEMGPIIHRLANAPDPPKKPKGALDRLYDRLDEWTKAESVQTWVHRRTGAPPMGVWQRMRADIAKHHSNGIWVVHAFQPGESRDVEMPKLEDVPPAGSSFRVIDQFGCRFNAARYWDDDWHRMDLQMRLQRQFAETGCLDAPVDEIMTALERLSGIAVEVGSITEEQQEFLWACVESVRAQLSSRRGRVTARNFFDDAWYRQVPRVHRWLVGDTSERFEIRDQGHDYWFAAYYLCRAILGWSDVGRALQGLPSMNGLDGPAHLLVAGWGKRLDALGLWAWTHGEAATAGASHGERDPARYATGDRQGTAEGLLSKHGFTGGYDMFHLGPHLSGIEGPLGARAVSGNVKLDAVRQGRRIVLVVDRFEEWPVHLGALGAQLKGAEPPSWAVDVVSRRDGALGQWRRCWECKRWFQGRAEWHKLGHLVK